MTNPNPPITISFRRGTAPPTAASGLTLGEPAFDTVGKNLYIGLGSGVTAAWVGAQITGSSADVGSGLTAWIPTAGAVKGYIDGVEDTLVRSVNGATGAVTDVARTVIANSFTPLQSFGGGISASGGSTFDYFSVRGITSYQTVEYNGITSTFILSQLIEPNITISSSSNTPNIASYSNPLLDRTADGGFQSSLYGYLSQPKILAMPSDSRFYAVGIQTNMSRGSSYDVSSNSLNGIAGVQIFASHNSTLPESAYTNTILGVNQSASVGSGTANSVSVAYVQSNVGNSSVAKGCTANALYGLQMVNTTVGHASSGKSAYVGNWYQIWLGRGITAGLGTIGSNRWGIYQTDPLNRNYFAGSVQIGTTALSGALGVSGSSEFTGLASFGGGISAAGGVTFNGTFSGSTASFSRLATFDEGISAGGWSEFDQLALRSTSNNYTRISRDGTVQAPGTGIYLSGLVQPVINTTTLSAIETQVGIFSAPVLNRTAGGGVQSGLYGLFADSTIQKLPSDGRIFMVGGGMLSLRGSSADVSTHASNQLSGVQIQSGHLTTLDESAYTNTAVIVNSTMFLASGTINQLDGYRLQGDVGNASTAKGVTANTIYGYVNSNMTVGHASSGKSAYVGNWYQIWLGRGITAGLGTIGSNRWGIYQTDPLNRNYFAGSVQIGTTALSGELGVSGSSEFTGLASFGGGISAAGGITFGGLVNAPTRPVGTNDTTIATTAFAQSEIDRGVVKCFATSWFLI